MDVRASSRGRWASHGLAGLFLIAVCWPLTWFLPGLRSHLLFFPLWLGYILVVDALVLRRRGTSMLTRSRRGFTMLFALSAPAWWLFELINLRTQNWHYIGAEDMSRLTYALTASLAFSTVIPAVFESAELIRSFGPVDKLRRGPRVPNTGRTALVLLGLGLTMLGLVLSLPTYFYPFVWGAAYCLLEPLNMRLGRGSLLEPLSRGDWRPVVALGAGALLCGFFWEMWNYYALPKWVYTTPGVEFSYVFEMPLVGFIGYIPFSFELYALFHLFKWRSLDLKL